jgi:hypothetical protein
MPLSMSPRLFVYHNGRFLPTLFVLLLLGAATTCQNNPAGIDPIGTLIAPQPTPDSAATAWAAATQAAQPPPTPDYAPGQSRSSPLPAGSLINMDNWDVQVLDMIRGEAAWEILQEANQFNEPPAPNREYLLLQFWIKNKSRDEGSLWLNVTGSRHQLYKYYRADVVRPQPRLETNLAGGKESLGWLAYDIAAGESNLILRLEDGLDFRTRTSAYVALEDGASLHRPPALDAITPTEWGQSLTDPLILGQIATTNSWQMQVKEVILGDAAYEKILTRNRFNEPPAPGMQYGLAYVWVRYIGPGESAVSIGNRSVEAIDAAGEVYPRPSLVVPNPELQGELYPGGEAEGWLVLQIPATENAPLLRLELSRHEVRYLSLAATGR